MHEVWFFLVARCMLNAWQCMNFVCFVLYGECVYECMKFDFSKECMLKCMKFVWIWILILFFFENMHIWMHEIWLIFFLFLKNTYMNAWNFVNFLKENACLNALKKVCLFDFILFFLKEWTYECIKLYFF